VIAPEENHTVTLIDFDCKQEEDGFESESPPVDLVAKEQLVGGLRVASNGQYLVQILELAVDVSHHHKVV